MSRGSEEAAARPAPQDDLRPAGAEEDFVEIIPEGYESQEEWLAEVLKLYTDDFDADKHNIDEAMKDLTFIYVDQWDPEVRAAREEKGRPCMTVNTMPQFIGQVVGDRRINQTRVKVIPDKAGSVKTAEVRSGLIRSIENYSRADTIYDQCCEDQVGCGISNYEITMEYATNDVFEQDIFIRPLANPFAVVWDRFSRNPTGRDAQHCFVEEVMPREMFESQWPNQSVPDSFNLDFDSTNFGMWIEDNDVKIVAYWKMIEKPAVFALMQDGQIEDVTEMEEDQYMDRVQFDPSGQPMIRESYRTYAQRWLITSFAILEGPYELPLTRLPIIKVSGRVGRVGTRQYRFGLVRWARDPSMLRNYWRSVAAEQLAMQPRNVWTAEAAAVKGREEDFRNAHITGDPLLVYNTGKEAPKRVDAPQIQSAVLNEANINAQDIKDVTGLHDASLGIRSNEVSGKAIMARQREGDVATIGYHDHLNEAIREGGVVINDLIPVCYDTMRTIRKIGADEAAEFVTINDPDDEASPDISGGRYDVELITGPSYTTQRMESAEAMLEAVKVFPQIMEVAGDLMVEAQDWPKAQQIAARLKKLIPAAQEEEAAKEAAEAEASGQPVEPSPEQLMQMQQMEQQTQMAQQAQEMQMQQAQLALQEQEYKTAKCKSEAEKAEQEARRAEADADRAEAEAASSRAELVRKTAEAEIAEDEVEFNKDERALDIHLKANPPKPENESSSNGGAPRRAARSRSKRKTQWQSRPNSS